MGTLCSNKTLGELKDIGEDYLKAKYRVSSNKTLGELKAFLQLLPRSARQGSNKTLGELKVTRLADGWGLNRKLVPIRL